MTSSPTVSTSQGLTGYSVAAATKKIPKKEQGIVFDMVEGKKNEEYLKAICTKIKATDIHSASRITMNRFLFFVHNVDHVEQLTTEGNNVITVGSSKLTMRPYIARLKRVILSNVMPFIPDNVIEAKLKEMGIQLRSAITPLRISAGSAFAHIESFRRQIFVHPDDIEKFDSDFSLNYDSTTYHIYVNMDKMKCFECGAEGHTTRQCPELKQEKGKQKQIELSSQLTNNNTPADKYDNKDNTSDISSLAEEDSSITTESTAATSNLASQSATQSAPHTFNGTQLFSTPTTATEKNKKRIRPVSSNGSVNSDIVNPVDEKAAQDDKSIKRKKTISKTTSDKVKKEIELAKSFISTETSATFPMSFEQLIELISATLEVSYCDIPTIIKAHTTNVESLIIMLEQVRKHVETSSFKTRLTKTVKALSGAVVDSASESDAAI